MAEVQSHEVDLITKQFDRILAVIGAIATFATAIGVFNGIYFGAQQISQQQPVAIVRTRRTQGEMGEPPRLKTHSNHWKQCTKTR